jgi:GAF domain-containing protein
MRSMALKTLPSSLEALFAADHEPEALFEALLPLLCDILKTDRCFLEVRKPSERLYRVFCWRRSSEFPDMTTNGWQREQPWEEEDPLFAASLRAEPSIYVEDVETAPPDVLNLEFERKYFGHRALVHAHICQDGVLHGILQPCVFGHPRVWSPFDRAVIDQVTERLRPTVVSYGETASLEK